MQLIIMDTRLARSRTIHLTGGRLVAAGLAASFVLMSAGMIALAVFPPRRGAMAR